MLANHDKFLEIYTNCEENDMEIKIDGSKLFSEDHIKLLGVNLNLNIFQSKKSIKWTETTPFL